METRLALEEDRRGCPMSCAHAWLGEKTASEDQGRESQDGHPFSFTDPEPHCRWMSRAGEEKKVSTHHGNAVEGGGGNDRDADVRTGLDRAVNKQLG
jgi:hypothetical protein